MKITIITPLFPPDTGAPAPYVKTLAQKLPYHSATLIIFGYLPETVKNTKLITINKRKSKIYQLLNGVILTFKHGRNTNLILVNNGPISELTALICSFFIDTPIILCVSDPLAAKKMSQGLYGFIHKLLTSRLKTIIKLPDQSADYLPPEILPFTEPNQTLINTQALWWQQHLTEIFSYAK